MVKDIKFIPTFTSFGWKTSKENFNKIKNTLAIIRNNRSERKIPIFSIIDSDKDLEYLEHNARFFTNSETKTEEFILIGTGGSSLGAEAFIKSLRKRIKFNFHILDDLNSFKIAGLLEKIESKVIKVLAISKSGNTIETISLLLIICDWLESRGYDLKNNVMVMSDETNNKSKNNILEIANIKDIKTINHERNVSGRFSSLASTGLLPAAIMGADPYSIRKAARKTLDYILDEKNFLSFGSAFFSDNSVETNKLNCLISYGDFLEPMVRWYRQLWSESLGKEGKGNFFVSAKGPLDQHSQLQMWLDGPNNGFFTFLVADFEEFKISVPDFQSLSWLSGCNLENLSGIMANSTYQSLQEKNRPVRMIKIPSCSPESIAALMTIYLTEVIVLAETLNINPYDQPAVENIKINILKGLKINGKNF